MKLYTLNAIDTLINKYIESEGSILTLEKGSLGYGHLLLVGNGLKTCIIKERYLNESSSGHSVRFYSETPKKYQALI